MFISGAAFSCQIIDNSGQDISTSGEVENTVEDNDQKKEKAEEESKKEKEEEIITVKLWINSLIPEYME